MADIAELPDPVFDQIASLGDCFVSPSGVTIVPVTYQGKELYALADQDDEEQVTYVFALVADEQMLAELQPREGMACTLTRKAPVA